MTAHRRPDVRGFTLVELLISVTLGVVILSSALGFAIATYRGAEGNKLREEVYRNARFIGMALQRDFQTTGVGIESSVEFGTLNVFNDTVVTLHVPWEPTSWAYEIYAPGSGSGLLPPGGTCGDYCIDLEKAEDGTFDLVRGDLARLQVNSERRLIVVSGVVDRGATVELEFLPDTAILHLPAGFSGGLRLDRTSTFVQRLRPIVYYAEDGVLYRADHFDGAGDLVGAPVAYGVQEWRPRIVFTDGDEADAVDPYDASDFTDDFDDLLGVHISALLSANRVDMRVNQGQLFTQESEWRLVPRNLMYERNR